MADLHWVRILAWRQRAWRPAAVVVLVAATVSGPFVVPRAHADTTGAAQAKVTSLLGQVHSLQARAHGEEQRYQRAFSAVANGVNEAITADESHDVTRQAAQAAHGALVSQVQDLYESGGPAAAYASLLVNGDVSDFSARATFASRVVGVQSRSVSRATSHAAATATAADRAITSERHRIGTERGIAVTASKVQGLLDGERALLAKADSHLAAVKAAEQALAAQTAAFSSITTTQIAGLHVLPPPAQYLSLYKSAAQTCPGLSWTVLAAIGQVESGHGRDLSTSPAGAMGPMQFEPATFASYAVDGDHDGQASIMSPADSIFTAAHYLCANGAGQSPAATSAAILRYNHAGWYVAMVLKLSGLYASYH